MYRVHTTRSLAATHVAALTMGLATFAAADSPNVVCWGRNDTGQCAVPLDLNTAIDIGGGWKHTIALRLDGTVRCWGSNEFGQSAVPTGLASIVSVAAGWEHSMAVNADGTLWCWGNNGEGQCDVLPGLVGVARIAGGHYHSMALRSTGTVACWGSNGYGQRTVPAGLSGVVGIDAGGYHSGAIKSDGTVTCWGRNLEGQRTVPTGLTSVIDLGLGVFHSVALRSDGTLVCWGGNANGQCNVPSGLSGVISIFSASSSTIALKADGTAVCWGENSFGENNVPPGLAGLVGVSKGDGFSMALTAPTRLVPSHYPTIQAAIDASPLGSFSVIQVAAGIYNASFALNGKNVVVRGTGAHATIIDGTGLTTSIARFTGGEPATAGLENLVLRNGIAGTIVNPNSPFAAGGALYALSSNAFIHNCRFESNRARYGGAAYCFNCTLDIADCAFIDNTSLGDAGGIEAFRCAGSVTNTLFDGNRSGTKSQAGGSAIKTVGAMTVNGTVTLDGCTIQDGLCIVGGAAIEHYEDVEGVAGVLRIHNCSISNNHSGYDAGGIYNIGRMQACILSGSTSVCSNTEYNIDGPYYLEGDAQVCDCVADLTHDGFVNAADLGVLLNAWGLTLPSGAGDVNHNGVVDAEDITLLLSAWGACS